MDLARGTMLCLSLLMPPLAGGCDRADREADRDAFIDADELASHLGVRKYAVEIPAGIDRPVIYLQARRRGEDPEGGGTLSVGESREVDLLISFDAREGGDASVLRAEGGVAGIGIGAAFPDARSISRLTRGEPTVASGDWLILCGTAGTTEGLEKDPEWAYRLYVLEEGQTPGDAGW